MSSRIESFPLAVSFRTIDREQSAEAAKLLASSAASTLEIWEDGFGSDTAAVDSLKQELLHGGIEVRTVHARFGADVDISSPDSAVREAGITAFRQALDLADRMDGGIVVVHPSAEPIEIEDRADRLALAKESITRMAVSAAEVGKSVAVELLPRTCLGRTAAELKDLVDGTGAANCGVCVDTNHLMSEYASLPDVIRDLGPRVIALHCSDYDGVDEKHWAPLSGVIDWAQFVDALREIEFPGPLNYEAKLDGETPAERLAFLEDNYKQLCEVTRNR